MSDPRDNEEQSGLPGLHRIRVIRGLTQLELSRAVGVSNQVIGQYELGNKNPKMSTVTKIMRVLKCSLKDLMSSE